MRCLMSLSLLLSVGLAHSLHAEVVLTRVISHEDPALKPDRAQRTIGRDGRVYIASGGNDGAYILRVDRDGGNRFGGTAVYAIGNATANRDGIIASANGHFAHKIALYDRTLKSTGELADFLNNDTLGWSGPPHVEAGASGDFYGLDHNRDRLVRLDPSGKQLRAYPIPRHPAGHQGQAWDFRVCEKTETFTLLPASGPVFRVGFDGKLRWILDGKTDPHVRRGDHGTVGGFDVDENGNLLLLGPYDSVIRIVSPEGKQLGTRSLTGGRAPAKPGQSVGVITGLRVHGEDILVSRRHPTELFSIYDRQTGAHRRTVESQAELLTVRFSDRTWKTGTDVPLTIEQGRDGQVMSTRTAWRVRLRGLDEMEGRDVAWRDGKVTVPAGLGGMYLLRVSPEVRSWQGGNAPEHLLETWVELRAPNTSGTLDIRSSRACYALGESIDVTLTVPRDCPVRSIFLELRAADGAVVQREEHPLQPNAPTKLTLHPSGGLPPGSYLLTTQIPGLTTAAQPMYLGPHRITDTPEHFFVQYGDYGPTYPNLPPLNALPVASADALRLRKIGVNLTVDRLGQPLQFGVLTAQRPAELSERTRLSPAIHTLLSARGASGISQMAILMGNDAGLPLGTGFDPRKPETLVADAQRVTKTLSAYPTFRGWSWSSNWWVFGERGANAARTPEERASYEAALKRAKETGVWNKVLDQVAERRLSYARDAQELFNRALAGSTTRKLTTASAAPYRNVEAYPPLCFANVDEVDLQAQWEQIAVPYVSAHAVDFYRRPNKRAWLHPEIWNDAGTGDQVIPTLFQGLMRGAEGVGFSGPVPPWAPRLPDVRHGHAGQTSLFRAMGTLSKQYGPWLNTLQNNDQVAILVSGRMLKIDDWPNVYGTHFARLLEAYAACLHAHHPATFVWSDDLAPATLTAYKAVLVVGQRVEPEAEISAALRFARKAGVRIFHDETCRPELVRDCTALGVAFNQFERDPSPASDDAAYFRFPAYCLKHVPALHKALDPVATRVAKTTEPELLLSQRQAGKGRFVFAVNNTTPELTPGQMWRMSLLVASRVPRLVPLDLGVGQEHVYDVFAGKELDRKAIVADCRDLQARLFAVLPARIESVAIQTDKVRPGARMPIRVEIRDANGRPIPSNFPVRLRFLGQGGVFRERYTTVLAGASEIQEVFPRNAGRDITLEVCELISGKSARLAWPEKPTQPEAWSPIDRHFGPHLRDAVVSSDGTTAYCNAFNWDHNLYAVDLKTGTVRWRQRVGQYFAFAPQTTTEGLAVQGFDFATAEGYHLHLLDRDGKGKRRFSLFGLPGRLPHRFVPSLLGDQINNFAVAPNGQSVAVCGNLGLAVWKSDGSLLWRQDWWRTQRKTQTLTPLDNDTLLRIDGLTATAHAFADGKPRWSQTLAASGEVRAVRTSANGRTVAFLTTTDGGQTVVLRDGKPHRTIPAGGEDLALSADGETVLLVTGRLLSCYRGTDLIWVLPGDDALRHVRLRADGQRIACCSELGTLYVLDANGRLLLERDLNALAVPTWLPDGDLFLAGWMGTTQRLGADFVPRWTTLLRPTESDMKGKLLSLNITPTTRVSDWGNAAPAPRDIRDNLLNAKTCLVEFRSTRSHVHLSRPSAALVDGKEEAHPDPWLPWPEIGWFAEGSPFNYLLLDTFRRRLRVEAITLMEDAKAPESWLRDARLEYWDANREQWKLALELLSDAPRHTHTLPQPIESARWRIVPRDLSGNLRLTEIALHGKEVGPAHPDVIAGREVAVLFDEEDELREARFVGHGGLTFAFGGAHSGGRYLRLDADRSVAPLFRPPFGHVLPTWDFEIAEQPGPGQYRWLEFAARGLSEKTSGWTLRLDGDGYGRSVSCTAGPLRKEADAIGKQVAQKVESEWRVYRVDLWDVFQKPVRIRGLRLATTGGPAGFDAIRLRRSTEMRGKETRP